MTTWPYFGAFNPFAPAALPHCMQAPIAANDYRRTPKPDALPKDMADFVVFVTREALVATSTTVGQASSETHDALLRVNQALAFERMSRAMNPWAAAATANLMTQVASAASVPAPTGAASAATAGFGPGSPALAAVMSLSAAFMRFAALMPSRQSALS